MTVRRSIGVSLEEDALDAWARPLLGGAATGSWAFLVSYVSAWVLIQPRVGSQFGGSVPTWKGVGWYTFNGHFVGLESTGGFGPFSADESTNLLALSVDVATDVLFLLPPFVLVAAGALACLAIEGPPRLDERLAAGVGVTVAYVVLFLVGALLTSHHVEGLVFGIEGVSETVRPSLGRTFAAGLGYPLVFATLGSFVTGELRH